MKRLSRLSLMTVGAVVAALVTFIVVPTSAQAQKLADFDIRSVSSYDGIRYIDYVMVNGIVGKSIIITDHRYEGRSVGGGELYDNSTVASGNSAEYASNNSNSRQSEVSYTWAIIGTQYRVQFLSRRQYASTEKTESNHEVVYCRFFMGSDYSREVTDAPFNCDAQFGQGQYGHTTEYLTLTDKNPSQAMDADPGAAVEMVSKLCGMARRGANVVAQVNCQNRFDFSNQPVATFGNPVVLTSNDNCQALTITDALTSSTALSNTVTISNTTTVGFKITKEIVASALTLEGSITNAVTYATASTTSTTDTRSYAVPALPGTRGRLTIAYPIYQLKGTLTARIASANFDLTKVTFNLLRDGDEPKIKHDDVHLGRADCPNLPADKFAYPPVN